VTAAATVASSQSRGNQNCIILCRHTLFEVGEMNERVDRPRQYFCCVCRKKLPRHHRGYFHKECLREDKRRRTREKREQERNRFRAWVRRRKCFTCGGAFAGSFIA